MPSACSRASSRCPEEDPPRQRRRAKRCTSLMSQATTMSTAEERAGNVPYSLGHQFHIRIMPVSGHAIGDHRRQQGFYGRQERDRKRVGKHRSQGAPVESRNQGCRQRGWDTATTGANGVHRKRKYNTCQGRRGNSRHRDRNPWIQEADQHYNKDSPQADQLRQEIESTDRRYTDPGQGIRQPQC